MLTDYTYPVLYLKLGFDNPDEKDYRQSEQI